jgi:putative membrane protein
MLVRLSAAVAAICMLSGAALAQGAAKLTDPQIATHRLHGGTTRYRGREASTIEVGEQIRAFAEGMVSDHTAVNKKALDLVTKLKVTPEDNDTSRALTKAAADERAELAKLSGAAFDKAYIANEVAYHKTVNGALESTLIPSAGNSELKSLLQTGLKIFQGHEQQAEKVAAELK